MANYHMAPKEPGLPWQQDNDKLACMSQIFGSFECFI